MRELVIRKYARFNGFGQHDCHEFLRALLDCLRQEELMIWRKGILDKCGFNEVSRNKRLYIVSRVSNDCHCRSCAFPFLHHLFAISLLRIHVCELNDDSAVLLFSSMLCIVGPEERKLIISKIVQTARVVSNVYPETSEQYLTVESAD